MKIVQVFKPVREMGAEGRGGGKGRERGCSKKRGVRNNDHNHKQLTVVRVAL